jgi:hypothetical protein
MTLDALEYPRAFQSNSRQPGYKGNFSDEGPAKYLTVQIQGG